MLLVCRWQKVRSIYSRMKTCTNPHADSILLINTQSLTVPAGPIRHSDSLLERKWHEQGGKLCQHQEHSRVVHSGSTWKAHRHERSFGRCRCQLRHTANAHRHTHTHINGLLRFLRNLAICASTWIPNTHMLGIQVMDVFKSPQFSQRVRAPNSPLKIHLTAAKHPFLNYFPSSTQRSWVPNKAQSHNKHFTNKHF